MRCIPGTANTLTLNWKRHYQSVLPELNAILQKIYNGPPDEPLVRTFTVYFGRIENETLDMLARKLFDLFRFPLMRVTIKFNGDGKWVVDNVDQMNVSDLPKEKHPFFVEALNRFTGSAWKNPSVSRKEKHWIAILYDPQEIQPPSDKKALQKFVRVGKAMNVSIELITKQDFASLLEYDALFIRETTAINHHTFRFALKAESEQIPCIDDTKSIIRCCNKVFQYELLASYNLPLPDTKIVDRKFDKTQRQTLNYPGVLKIPDGAFSRGVVKVENPESFQAASEELLRKSEIILYQEFLRSEFDWRIGILGGQPLFACKYYMAQDHWQIYNHNAKTIKRKMGKHETLSIEKVPEDVLKTALKAANLIGTGFYGVDLKQTEDGKIVIMEVNDNPSLDHNVEDQVLGDVLYRQILEHFVALIEA